MEEARRKGWDLTTVPLDVSDAPSVRKARRAVEKRGDCIEILINNAGYGLMGPLEDLPIEEIRKQFDTNVFGPIQLIHTFLPHMRAMGRGRIVNVSSVAGRISFPFGGAYCASKFALEAFSDALRMELRPFGFHVILVEPGPVRTAFSQRAREISKKYTQAKSHYRKTYEKIIRRFDADLSRGVDPERVAEVVLKAVEDQNPKSRYLVTMSDKAILMLKRLLPEALFEAGMTRRFGLNSP